ncbi:response regulator transcription factor [Ekhidna sp.]|uniref:response regulator transcription factor n=1 Tax=Ekhidna sp. TaxID=2608089 RepID=UPI0032EDC2D9
MSQHTLFIIDDHKIVRDGLKAMLLGRPDISVIGEASSGKEAIEKLSQEAPSIIFVDLKLPDANGSVLAGEILKIHPNSKCAILTADPNPTDLKRAQEVGVLAFLTKDMVADEYFRALDNLIDGKRYISTVFSEILINSDTQYTPREIEVLRGFSDGLSYKEIGARLDMSPRTVETHKNHLLEKMQVKSIVEMVRKGIRDGLIEA